MWCAKEAQRKVCVRASCPDSTNPILTFPPGLEVPDLPTNYQHKHLVAAAEWEMRQELTAAPCQQNLQVISEYTQNASGAKSV